MTALALADAHRGVFQIKEAFAGHVMSRARRVQAPDRILASTALPLTTMWSTWQFACKRVQMDILKVSTRLPSFIVYRNRIIGTYKCGSVLSGSWQMMLSCDTHTHVAFSLSLFVIVGFNHHFFHVRTLKKKKFSRKNLTMRWKFPLN